jgi:DNA-binding LacI/PurR family transcriptional regulator
MDGIRPGKPVTLDEVARVAGVSRATVSRVVNGLESVDPALRDIVQRAVAQTKYVPNIAARSLASRRTGSIALVVSEAERPGGGQVFADPFFGGVVANVLLALRARGLRLVLSLVDDQRSRTHLLSSLGQGYADGVILAASYPGDPLPRQLAEARVPAVAWGRPEPPAAIASVDVDQQAGARIAAEHLVARGCRRVATIHAPLTGYAGRERLAGFRRAMAAHGHRDVTAVGGDGTREGGAAAARRLLAEHPDVDGLFVASDAMALGALTVVYRHGRRVPDDVAIVGFDDSAAAAACDPPLTTVRQPVEDMAGEVDRLLSVQLADPDLPRTSTVFHPALVLRGTA